MITETPLLLLREMNEKDLPDLREILQDPVAMTAYEGAFDEAMVMDWLDRQLQRYARDGMGLWAVIRKEDGAFLGQCGLTWQQTPDGQVPEIGYLFKRRFWHQGWATRAFFACLDYGFAQKGFSKLYSIIRDTNLASQRVAQRGGMVPVGGFVKQYRGVEMPHLLYCIDRQTWLRNRAGGADA